MRNLETEPQMGYSPFQYDQAAMDVEWTTFV